MVYEEISGIPQKQKEFDLLNYEQFWNIIIESLKIYLQNVWKNRSLIETLLKTQKNFDILFIQEPPWSII